MGMTYQPLGLSQVSLGARHACTTISVWLATGYLLYSKFVHLEGLKEWLRQACEHWKQVRPTLLAQPDDPHLDAKDEPLDFERPLQVLKRHPILRECAVVDDDLECNGLVLEDLSKLDELPDQVRQAVLGEQSYLLLGLEPAFQKLAKAVLEEKEEEGTVPVRGFVFTRDQFTVSGSVRRVGTGGGLQFDLVDSHSVKIPDSIVQHSGLWAQCDSVASIVTLIEMLYPTNDEDEWKVKQRGRHAADIQMSCMYNLVVFKRRRGGVCYVNQQKSSDVPVYVCPLY
jgi:hypothetical protein